MELGWTPEQFWKAAVPEFWCAVDWIAEKNLEVEEQLDAAKAGQARATYSSEASTHPSEAVSEDTTPITVSGYHIPRGHERVRYNPNLRVRPNPEFAAWRERLRVERGI